MRLFKLPDGGGQVVFTDSTLRHMYEFAQRRFYSKESGGQLFSPNPHHEFVEITHATGPYPEDKRSRSTFVMAEGRANNDRHVHFKDGRYAVGLWHTHPEHWPRPSSQDEQTTRAYLEGFQGDMTGFLLVILGNAGVPPAMTVWLATKNSFASCVELSEGAV